MNNFHGKHIWIIGASSGIGKALAKELAGEGATLALSARNEDKLKNLNEALEEQHHVCPLDVTNHKQIEKTAQALKEKFSKIDSVIFLAAIYAPTELDTLDIDEAHKIIDVNLGGAFNLIYSVLPLLKEQGSAQMVLCGSVAGYRGLPAGQPYSATKAGIINLAESLKAEQSDLDIKVINPGFVRTPMTDKNDFDMPMMIEPEDAAKAIARGLKSSAFEIHFPKKFTFFMKLLRVLPNVLFFSVSKKIKQK